jgi:hypothetical protein
MLHTLHFSLQNAFYFIMLHFLVPVLFPFYIQDVLANRLSNSEQQQFSKLISFGSQANKGVSDEREAAGTFLADVKFLAHCPVDEE